MAIDIVDIKYFKLAVGQLKKQGINDLSLDCPLCDDTKNRLHLYQNDGMDQALAHCYNAGCDLSEQQMGMVNFLKLVKPQLVPQYKRERFTDIMGKIKEDTKLPSLNDILANAKKKSQKEIPEIEVATEVKAEITLEVKPEKKELKIPDIFKAGLIPFNKSIQAMNYIKNRGLEPEDDWLFSEGKFVEFFGKAYYVQDFFLMPLFYNNKFQGFYTRSIYEKRFSTIIFPKKEKIWCSNLFNSEDETIICEGIFDALSTGFNSSIAMLSADINEEILNDLKNPIFAFDNDKTGKFKSLKYVDLGYKVFIWPLEWDKYKDFNEILMGGTPQKIIKAIISKYIYKGIEAKIKLSMVQV